MAENNEGGEYIVSKNWIDGKKEAVRETKQEVIKSVEQSQQ